MVPSEIFPCIFGVFKNKIERWGGGGGGGGGTEQQQQTYMYQGYNILHRLQVHHLTLIFIIHNKYISTRYLYTYIHTYTNCSSQLLLMIMLFIYKVQVIRYILYQEE